MSGTDEYLRALLHQATEEEAFLNGLRQANDLQPGPAATAAASPPSVSLMITNQQRAELSEIGFSDESIRTMTPAEAHAHLGLSKPNV